MNTQINAYLAVGYACNQKCRCCPIANNANKDELIVPFERIEKEADTMKKLGITDVTISGGEPTIHPDFLKIIDLFFARDISVHVLSNGERFSEPFFSKDSLMRQEESRSRLLLLSIAILRRNMNFKTNLAEALTVVLKD